MRNIKKATHFCGNLKRDELNEILTQNKIEVNEIEVYRTVLNERKFEEVFDAVLFYSPSGVQSFIEDNETNESIAFCIGQTTANEAKKNQENN